MTWGKKRFWGEGWGNGRPAGGPLMWTNDGTSNKAMPANIAEAAALLSVAGANGNTIGLYHFGAPASGNVSDSSGNGKTLTASGTWAYQQTVSGWVAKSIKSTAGTSAQLIDNTLANVNAQSYTLYLWAHVSVITTIRTIMHLGDVFDDSLSAQTIAAPPRLSLGNGFNNARVNGTSDPTAAPRPFVLSGAAGVDITAGVKCLLCTDQEAIASGVFAANGTELMFGGNGTDSWQPSTTDYLFGMLVDSAHSATTIKSVLQTAGWTIPW